MCIDTDLRLNTSMDSAEARLKLTASLHTDPRLSIILLSPLEPNTIYTEANLRLTASVYLSDTHLRLTASMHTEIRVRLTALSFLVSNAIVHAETN